MTTPNNMPKRPNPVRQQILADLISTSKYTREKKILVKDEDGKEQVETEKITDFALRFPLAGNVSDENVERLSRKWL